MKTRLKACDRWHPTEPSELHLMEITDGYGNRKLGSRCHACDRTRAQLKAAGAPIPPRLPRVSANPFADYGVLPRLTWSAPEFLL
jgi:hypothetical protein